MKNQSESTSSTAVAISADKQSPYLPKADGFRDTMESIIIAFIFAFVFRAFIVEAFVIPTGSMAPTLFGLHGKHRCAACRYPYTYGIKEPVVIENRPVARGTLQDPITARCPNCGWASEGNILNEVSMRHPVVADAGDRILVLKWPYDIGGDFLGPHRWDVVVFKNPEDGDQNFIKRLIGMPGEVLEIIDGDVYAAKASTLSPELAAELSKPADPRDGEPRRELTPALRQELDKALKIQRKTPMAQDSLWILHYDHDFPPDPATVARNPNAPGWRSEPRSDGRTPWDANSPCVVFNPIDDDEHALKLTGKAIRDGYGYNMAEGEVNVSDLKLRFVVTPGDGNVELSLSLHRGDEEFRARLQMDGSAALERRTSRVAPVQIRSGRVDPLVVGRPVTVEFQRLDYVVSLLLDGREVFSTTDRDFAPDIARLRNTSEAQMPAGSVQIAARKGPLEISHLTVYRDVYYRSAPNGGSPMAPHGRPLMDPMAGKHWWGTANNPILLRGNPGEYFCCGDNSPQSKDSRLWFLDGTKVPRVIDRVMAEHGGYQFGTVPADQMIGRAFFVYWPGGLRLSENGPPVIPNVGRMRIIR